MGFSAGSALNTVVYRHADRDTGLYWSTVGRIQLTVAGTTQHLFYDFFVSDPAHSQTNAGSAYVVVLSNGQVVRSTSVRASKISRQIEGAARVSDPKPKTYRPHPDYLGEGLDRDLVELVAEDVDRVFSELRDHRSWEVRHTEIQVPGARKTRVKTYTGRKSESGRPII